MVSGLEPLAPMTAPDRRLKILIANEESDRLAAITGVVEAMGHEVVVTSLGVDQVAGLSREHLPDVALVGLGGNGSHALEMISNIVREAACPVIAILDISDPAYVTEAAKRGVFAYVILDGDPAEFQSTLEITLRRFAEFHNLEGAFGRRAIIEQAKGILMARNTIDANAAYQLLKAQSQETGQKLIDIAQAITQTHRLFDAGKESPKPSEATTPTPSG